MPSSSLSLSSSSNNSRPPKAIWIYTAPASFFVVIAALAATMTATLGCKFFTTSIVNEKVFGTSNPIEFHAGLWFVEKFIISPNGIKQDNTTTGCVSWGDHAELDLADLDGAMLFARNISLLSSLASFFYIFIFLFVVVPYKRFVPHIIIILPVFFGVSGIGIMLSLVALASSWCKDAEVCKLQGCGIAAVAAFFLWMAAGLLTFLTLLEQELFARETREQQPEQPGMEAFQAAEAAAASMVPGSTTETLKHTIAEEDGSVFKVITRTVSHPDGSKYMTETKQLLRQGRPPYAATAVATVTVTAEDMAIPVTHSMPLATQADVAKGTWSMVRPSCGNSEGNGMGIATSSLKMV